MQNSNLTYQEWKIYDKITLFFDNLFTSYQALKQLNATIATLQQYKNSPFLLSDVSAFQYENNNHCELFSKNIQIIDTKQYITSQNQAFDNILFLQPIKQSSNIKYKPKKPKNII
ncbi:MAG: hypothetical protein Q4A69_05115 [Moraxella sp.]|nr:hypothetical protein [Moraxella sp.]